MSTTESVNESGGPEVEAPPSSRRSLLGKGAIAAAAAATGGLIVSRSASAADGGVTAELAIGEDVPAKGRLQKADGRMPGDRLTHRVLLKSPKDVDGEFKTWLAKAYELATGVIASSFAHEEGRAGMDAFIEKRPPPKHE